MAAGHLFLKSIFGEDYLPSVGWQIDPFGVFLFKKFILRLIA